MVQEKYCTKNDCYMEGKKLGKAEYLIVHSPAVYPTIIRVMSGSGGGWYKRWNKPGVEKLVHGFIDDTGVYDFAPHDMSCWHVGNSWGNAHCIGYEFCELEKKEEFRKMWDHAAVHYAMLCRKFGLSTDRILGHYEAYDKGIASNHSDPSPYFRRFGKSMADFRADVKAKLNGQSNGNAAEGTAVAKTYTPWAYARVCGLTEADPYLNVRTGPGTEYLVMRQLANRNEADVLELYQNGWAKVNITGQTGYVYAGYLDITERGTSDVQQGAPVYASWVGRVSNVGTVGLRVRTGPGTGYGQLSAWPKLNGGNLVDVTGESKEWYQVRIAGRYDGWCSKLYIERV